MNWSRGFFRLWLGLGGLWFLGWFVGAVVHLINPEASGSAQPLFWLGLLLTGVLVPAAALIFGLFIRWIWRGVTDPSPEIDTAANRSKTIR